MMKIIGIIVIVLLAAFVVHRVQNNKQAAIENRKAGETFLSHNAQEANVVTKPSGLQYLVLQEGSGSEHPQPNSRVKVHYHGTLVDGSVFDSSVERGQAIEFGLHQVIPGWTEGLQDMVIGEKRRLFIPPELGYGNRQAGSIPPGSVLIFDVELLAIN